MRQVWVVKLKLPGWQMLCAADASGWHAEKFGLLGVSYPLHPVAWSMGLPCALAALVAMLVFADPVAVLADPAVAVPAEFPPDAVVADGGHAAVGTHPNGVEHPLTTTAQAFGVTVQARDAVEHTGPAAAPRAVPMNIPTDTTTPTTVTTPTLNKNRFFIVIVF